MDTETNAQNLNNKRKQLVFRSWHRGTKEMDLLLGSFADRHVMGFDKTQLAQYEDILEINDPDLYDYKTGKKTVPANIMNDIFTLFLNHEFTQS